MIRLVLIVWVLCSLPVWGAEQQYVFDDPEQRQRFLNLTEELRCPMCQNQNIADSDAMIAADMRRKVYELVRAGESEQAVINYMKARYGDFVHYQPPLTSVTVWLWLLPVVFVFLAFTVVILMKKGETRNEDVSEKLAQAESMLKQEES